MTKLGTQLATIVEQISDAASVNPSTITQIVSTYEPKIIPTTRCCYTRATSRGYDGKRCKYTAVRARMKERPIRRAIRRFHWGSTCEDRSVGCKRGLFVVVIYYYFVSHAEKAVNFEIDGIIEELLKLLRERIAWKEAIRKMEIEKANFEKIAATKMRKRLV
eukprot:5925697-Pyramimonas_sp.AAC.1